MSNAAPDRPPALPGLEPIEEIGSGGYSTVYLYQQQMPRRRVAVKVMSVDAVATGTFESEADVMARVSAHPYIVSIYGAGVAEDGRPYLVMEHYPNANFLERTRERPLDVASVLRAGIQVSSALETAHRAGILHHDVKPANILVSEYGRPGLTDFGIASTDAGTGAQGVSIPWSPPEAFGTDHLDVTSDVYSLAATLYHLLAGRSPFAIPGGSNGQLDLIRRIEQDPVPPLGRSDVPESLERHLERAMSKARSARPSTVLEFARSLQAVEGELRLATTPLELPDVSPVSHTSGGAARSPRLGAESPALHSGVDGSTTARTLARGRPDREGGRAEQPDAGAIERPPAPRVDNDDRPNSARKRPSPQRPTSSWMTWKVGAIATASLVAFGVLGVLLLGWSDGESGSSGDAVSPTVVFSLTDGPSSDLLDPVVDLVGTATPTGVSFTWLRPDGDQPEDLVYVFTQTSDAGSATGRTSELSATIASEPGVEICVRVVVTHDGSSDSGWREACATR